MVCFAIVTDAWYVDIYIYINLLWHWVGMWCALWILATRAWIDSKNLVRSSKQHCKVAKCFCVFWRSVISCGQSLAKDFIWLESLQGWCSTDTLVRPAFWCIGTFLDVQFNSSIRFKKCTGESCSLQSFGVWDCFLHFHRGLLCKAAKTPWLSTITLFL